VLDRDRGLIAREIHAQMMAHFSEDATEYEVKVSRGFTELKPCNYTATAGQTAHHFRETVNEPSRIKQMLFGGFSRCLYPLQKFDSDTERRFAVILERDASKRFKPAKGQFRIYCKLGTEQPESVPDFVVETDSAILMVETKARNELNSDEVQAKAQAAARWCEHASDYAVKAGIKPWKYLLIPQNEINESQRISDCLHYEIRHDSAPLMPRSKPSSAGVMGQRPCSVIFRAEPLGLLDKPGIGIRKGLNQKRA
jgi:type III restriction enzyme